MTIPAEVLELVNAASPETWGDVYPRLFAAIVEYGLTNTETELVLQNVAKRLGVRHSEVWADWQTYLGRNPKELLKARPADLLRDLVFMEKVEVWRSTSSEVWMSIAVNGHVEHLPVDSAHAKAWLQRLFDRVYGRVLLKQAVEDVVNSLRAIGLTESAAYPVFTRLAGWGSGGERRVYLDLGRPDWLVVEVTADGWRVIPVVEAPVRFYRNSYQRSLPIPERGGSLNPLWEILPLNEERDRLLVLGWLLGALNPWGPYPVLILSGEKGAGKSTVGEFLKNLLDPTKAPRRSDPKSEDDMVVAAQNNWVIFYDNLSQIPPWLSDAFCRLSTGGGLSKRRLYTDSQEVVLEAQRPVILTGIAFGAVRDDLADRAIRVELTRIADEDRMTEAELRLRFQEVHPGVLGALLDAVADALKNFGQTQESLGFLPRLADWAVWVEAGAGRFGVPFGKLRDAFYEVQGEFDSDLLESNLLGGAVLLLTQDWPPGEVRRYTARELLDALEAAVFGGQVSGKNLPHDWPKTPEMLSKKLPRLQSALRSAGVVVRKERDSHRRQLIWVLEKKGVVSEEGGELPEYEL